MCLKFSNPPSASREGGSAPPTPTPSHWWLIHHPDGTTTETRCTFETTGAHLLRLYRGAIKAEPLIRTIHEPERSMTASQEDSIRAWLARIEETDPATVADVIERCQRDASERANFLELAANLPTESPTTDDRHRCDDCANLMGARCRAAFRGEIEASRDFTPPRGLLWRCAAYRPTQPNNLD